MNIETAREIQEVYLRYIKSRIIEVDCDNFTNNSRSKHMLENADKMLADRKINRSILYKSTEARLAYLIQDLERFKIWFERILDLTEVLP